ncbi:fasciclin domain-containing protein [Maribacter sp. HTCC2170]|uniref:fasciclin domain-containing protein n=1 Tax=Maribacter sp. (strain HTCC2170 / KCCM 42371) TaxID=313603 RepID=UPI00006B223D|nr:fasciclin domain-containing protein [Maribacter sp. HTCC2170]EAR00372.1 hypothetical protein FB2170_13161 [Maribacter sp. HTCC2170]
MKCYVPQVTLLTLFFTFFTTAQNNFSTFENDLLPLEKVEKSITTTTRNSENHTTLLAIMKAADLAEVLSYDGPYTVFAPSNMAFDKSLSFKTSDLFDPENKKDLQALLRYHIIAGEFSASKILQAMCSGEGKAVFTTVQGENLTATMSGTDIILTDSFGNSARITAADSNQCNGVIHEIDSVIFPKKISFLP